MKKAWLILAALVAGLLLGAFTGESVPFLKQSADLIGTWWLNALRMTVIPLVVALLVTGIVQTADAASSGRTATRSVVTMLSILLLVTIMAAIVTPLLLEMFPTPNGSGYPGATSAVDNPPPFIEYLKAIISPNVFASAANDALLPLIIFTIALAFAITRLEPVKKEVLSRFFEAMGEAMIVVIGWVLWLAPLGVFALGITLGIAAGVASFANLAHYVLIVTTIGFIIMLSAYPVAFFWAKFKPMAFIRAAIPAQSVAISTQSSLASLPAMVEGSKQLGVGSRSTDIVLPMAVAIFRATSPAMNLAVAIYVAHWLEIDLTPQQMALGVAVAFITTLGSVSLPGTISFVAAIAPICMVMGIPLEPLGLLVAIETFPDIMRTVGNVTMDIAVTGTVARGEGDMK
ncbi:MAG: cation:dicarboxylase symporter family transporter [Sphingorhabdus sp.]